MKLNVFYNLDASSGVTETHEASKLPEALEKTVLTELGNLLKNPKVLE